MKKLFLLLSLSFFAAGSFAQTEKPIYYAISFPNAVHHEAEIVMTLPKAPVGTIQFRMSRSSAGRYATHEFGKNIYNIKATDNDGNDLQLKQTEGDVYELDNHSETVKISYTLFGNLTDGTYASIDVSHAHLNMPAVILWTVGQDSRPITLEFDDLDKYGWKVATQLKHVGDNVYSAPNLQYLMDSPTELSNFKETSWKVVNTDGKTETINLTDHSDDRQETIDNFGKMVQKVVLEEKAVYGELPAYDFGEYTFLHDVYPTDDGDGMEHRNSTCIVDDDKQVAGNEIEELGTFAHEFFHCWNVKRIRPKSLEPFNFTHADMSSELWFAEGFTQYYGELLLVRSGFHNVDDYSVKTLSGLVNSVLNTPGAARYPETQMSRYAVFADAGVSNDPVNIANMFTTYYYYGGATALALDLRLRSEFNLTLDDYMKAVWLAAGKVQKPYTNADLQKILGKLTTPKFADDFFTKYINGIEKNNYEALLAKAGLILQKANPDKAWAGLVDNRMWGRFGRVKVMNTPGFAITISTLIGSPVYKAGLDAGDILVKADGKEVNDAAAFYAIVAAKNIGDKVIVDYRDRTGAHQTAITLEEDPNLTVVTYEKAGKALTKDQQDFRNSWLSSKVK